MVKKFLGSVVDSPIGLWQNQFGEGAFEVFLTVSRRYRLGVALSIDIPYLRALFVALSLMVQVVTSLLLFCLFVFLSFLSFS